MDSDSTMFLHFLLVRATELSASVEGPPATTSEPYRTEAPPDSCYSLACLHLGLPG